MGDRLSGRKFALTVVIAAVFVLLNTAGRTQDRSGKTGTALTAAGTNLGDEDRELRPLVAELKRLRSAGDLVNAAAAFARLFAIDKTADPSAAVKIEASTGSNRAPAASESPDKAGVAEGVVPVFFSTENEKNPDAAVCRASDGGRTLVSAAELWAGGGPRDIGIRQSRDGGKTWTGAVALGDGRSRTRPSLRQISDDAVGLIFAREWDGGDGDILFARLSEGLTAVAEHPVALSQADQRNPSLATDLGVFPSPYVYVVYAERDGLARSIRFRVSPDLGVSWSEAITVASWTGNDIGEIETALAYDAGKNALLVAFTRPQGRSTGIAVAVSRTFGASWSRPVFVTAADDLPDRSPRIAARRGTAVIVYERATAGGGSDIGLATSSNAGRSWSAGSLASTAADEKYADVRVSEGAGAGRFVASYVESGARIRVLVRDGTGAGSWTTDATLETGAAPVESGPVVLVPLPSSGGPGAAGIFWTGGRPDSDVLFSSAGAVILADMKVTPAGREVPFTAGSTSFTVNKTGEGHLSWTAAVTSGQDWLSIQSGASGVNSGTIVAGFAENPDTAPRAGTIRVSPEDIAIPPVTVTVTQAGAPDLDVTPAEGLISIGPQGGPFAPAGGDYTFHNTGGSALSWTASTNSPWLSLSRTSGLLDPGASIIVSVSFSAAAEGLGIGEHDAEVIFANGSNGLGDTVRRVRLTVTGPAGSLSVTPAEGLVSAGLVGGPFAPSVKAYTLQNPGTTAIDWTASKVEAWTSLSESSGSLSPGASLTVTVSINEIAGALAAGAYDDTVTFTNASSGAGTTTRPVSLTVSAPPGVLAVTPTEGLTSSGPEGGPFTPPSLSYTLQNTGGSTLDWTASKVQAWTSLSATSGTLAVGDAATVTVSVNSAAGALATGNYTDTISFVNTTTGNGSTTRPVALAVESGPALSVSPAHRDVPFVGGTAAFDVANAGAGTLSWTATVIAGSDWLSISSGSSGTGAGTIVAAAAANRTSAERTGRIRVTAAGAAGSPQDVTVSQIKGTLVLTLGAQRLVEKAWIIQREFARLTVGIDNPAAVPVETYVVYRRAGGGVEEIVGQVDGSTVSGSPLVFDNTFLEPGVSYTYRVAAIDVYGGTLTVSNAVTI